MHDLTGFVDLNPSAIVLENDSGPIRNEESVRVILWSRVGLMPAPKRWGAANIWMRRSAVDEPRKINTRHTLMARCHGRDAQWAGIGAMSVFLDRCSYLAGFFDLVAEPGLVFTIGS